MRTRSLAALLALALPVLAGAEEPPEEEPSDAALFPALDLRDEEAPAAPEETSVEAGESTPAPAPAAAPAPAPGAPSLAAPDAGPAADAPDAAAVALPLDVEPQPDVTFEDDGPLAIGLKADLLVPTSQVDTTGAISLELRYRLPWHERRIAIAADAGWYPLAGEGRSLDQQQGTFSFDWSLDSLPLHFGVEYLPPLPFRLPTILDRLRPYGEAGFAMAFLWSKASYRNADGETFIRDNLQKDTALGWYLGAGALYRIGPGDLVGGYRHDALKTDMDIPFANEESGDVGGSHVQAGYRLVF